ncbi:MAG TPA: EthD domain-containing protein [Burkholderiales bacterium]
MFKVIRMVKRGDKLPGEFRQEWLEHNRELRKTAARVKAGVLAEARVFGEEKAPFDGMATLYFSTVTEAAKAEDKGLGKGAISLVGEEKTLFERPNLTLKSTGQLKVVVTAVRKKGLSPAKFKDLALKAHSKVESKAIVESPIQKIVASFAMPQPGETPAFDGMMEIYFASAEDIQAAFGSPVIGMLRRDEETYVQMDAPEIRLVIEEHAL